MHVCVYVYVYICIFTRIFELGQAFEELMQSAKMEWKRETERKIAAVRGGMYACVCMLCMYACMYEFMQKP
jgi:hypothetical protein